MSAAFRKPQSTGPRAADISCMLAERIESLVRDLLPAGHREGHEWRAGNVKGDAGSSLGVHLVGSKAGIWCDFSSGERGDALDLIAAAMELSTIEAMDWARRWLGVDHSEVILPRRPAPKCEPLLRSSSADPVEQALGSQSRAEPQSNVDLDRWKHVWPKAVSIPGTLAETYLTARGLRFDDPEGRVLRFVPRRARKHPETDALEYHPALLAALSDISTGEQCGQINIYLRQDGRDRIRDRKGKTVTGRAANAVVMLSEFEEVTMGLTICEGVETGIAILQSGFAPVWACGSAGTLGAFPVLGGIESLTVAADADEVGGDAAEAVSARWCAADREVVVIAPPAGDWADGGAA